MRRFTTLWAGYLTSVLGSSLTALALGVWVFRETGSVTLYGVTIVMNFLPGILVAPVAGALVDRWNRRSILLVCNLVSIVAIGSLALLFLAGVLAPWHIYVSIGVQSVVRSMTAPTMSSIVVLLVPKEQVGRANGLLLLAQAVGGTLGFAAGGVLLLAIGLAGVLLVDCVSYLVYVAVLAFVSIPTPRPSAEGTKGSGRLSDEVRQGLRYLTRRRELVGLVVFFAALCVSVGYVDVVLTPMVLSFATAKSLGLVLAAAGLGGVLGSLVLTVWGGPRRRVAALAGFAAPLGAFMCLGALRPSVVLVMIAACGFTFCSTVVEGTTNSILQIEVEPDMQGRVFATFTMLYTSAQSLSYVAAGPVADRLFDPLLREGGALAGSVGSVLGVGRGRGMAFLVLLLGVAVLLTAVVGYLHPALRTLKDRPAKDAEEPVLASPAAAVESVPAAVTDRSAP